MAVDGEVNVMKLEGLSASGGHGWECIFHRAEEPVEGHYDEVNDMLIEGTLNGMGSVED